MLKNGSVAAKRLLLLSGAIACVVVATPVAAQGRGNQAPSALEQRHSIDVSFGLAMPQQETPMRRSADLALAYGYRIRANFQADAGLTSLYDGSGRATRSGGENTFRTAGYVAHVGARVLRTVKRGELFAGGGQAYQHYASQVRAYRARCATCESRGGWSQYGVVGMALHLGSGKFGTHTWLGIATAVTRGHTSGAHIGAPQSARTRDLWVHVAGSLSIRF